MYQRADPVFEFFQRVFTLPDGIHWAREAPTDTTIGFQARHAMLPAMPEIEIFQVEADDKRIERTKLVAERTLDAIGSGVIYPNRSAMNCSGCPYRTACSA